MNKPELCQFLLSALDGRVTMSAGELAENLHDWELRPIHSRHELAAILMIRGPEVHVAAKPDVRGRWLTRSLIREHLQPLLDVYGHLETSVMLANSKGLEFVQRLGFKEKSRSESKVEYVLETLSHA